MSLVLRLRKRSSRVLSNEEGACLALIEKCSTLEEMVGYYNIARSQGWKKAVHCAHEQWRTLVAVKLSVYEILVNPSLESVGRLYSFSPLRTPERRKVLSFLRVVNGKKLSGEQLRELQRKGPKIAPRR